MTTIDPDIAEPTPEHFRWVESIVKRLITMINIEHIPLNVMADATLNVYAQMTLEMDLPLDLATNAVSQAREHIAAQMAAEIEESANDKD